MAATAPRPSATPTASATRLGKLPRPNARASYQHVNHRKEALHDRRHRRTRRFRQIHPIAKEIARQLGFNKLDTGAMYRAVTFAALDRGIDLDNEAAIDALAEQIEIRFTNGTRRGHAPDH